MIRVKVIKASLAFVVAMLLAITLPARAEEIVTWNREPIRLTLPVGQERTLYFPDNVAVGVPATLSAEQFRTQSLSGAVYWLAKKPFDTQRLQIRLLGSGHIVLLDVTAADAPGAAKPEPLRVVFPAAMTQQLPAGAGNGDGHTAAATDADSEAPAITVVDLVRHAAQQLYAPQRLVRERPGIDRVPMRAPKQLPSLYRGNEVSSQPLATWSGADLYVTAVRLANQTPNNITLDPRRLRGDFESATFQHRSLHLGPKGSPYDTTTVYLVSARPFGDAIMQ